MLGQSLIFFNPKCEGHSISGMESITSDTIQDSNADGCSSVQVLDEAH